MSEAKLQTAFVNWMRSALPQCITYHNYLENAQNAIQGKIKKDRGVLAGVMDNTIIAPGPLVFYIELKDPNKPKSANKYGDSQKAFAERLDKLGIKHFCCQTGVQIEEAVRSMGLTPLFPFPRALEATKRLMLQQEAAFELYRRD